MEPVSTFNQVSPAQSEASEASAAEPAAAPWTGMERQISILVRAHPLVCRCPVVVKGDSQGLQARLRYREHTLEARLDMPSWWDGDSYPRRQQLAGRLARDLYAEWMQLLRRR